MINFYHLASIVITYGSKAAGGAPGNRERKTVAGVGTQFVFAS